MRSLLGKMLISREQAFFSTCPGSLGLEEDPMPIECIRQIARLSLIRRLKVIPIALHPRFKRKKKEAPPEQRGSESGQPSDKD
jgi:hypothetical protein